MGLYENMIDVVCSKGGNLLVIGQAGIGKTEIPFQRAAKHGLKTVYWNLSTQEAPDLVGLPIIKVEDGVEVVRYASPEYMPVADRFPKPVLVIVDELDKCKPDLQNPLLEIFHSRTLNGRKLAIQGIVATGNRPDEGAHSKPISLPLANRCQTFTLSTSFDSWRDWAVSAKINPLVIGFLTKHQEYLSQKPVVGDPTAYTRGSPRSWTEGGRDLDKLAAMVRENAMSFESTAREIAFQTITLAGRVGMEPATKFRVWLEFYKRIEPLVEKLVRDGTLPTDREINDMQTAETIVFAISSARAIVDAANVGEKKGPEAAKKEVHRVAGHVSKLLKAIPAEFQIAAIKSTLDSDFVKQMDLTKCPDLMRVYLSVRAVTKE